MTFWKRRNAQFFATGARFFGGTGGMDQAMGDGVVAMMDGDTLTFRWPDGRETYHNIPPGESGRIAKWSNTFNDRVREVLKQEDS